MIVSDAPSQTHLHLTNGSFRVLIVDDNPSIHEDFRKILGATSTSTDELDRLERELLGETSPPPRAPGNSFELDSAFQGEAALELVLQATENQKPYALAFVDVRMPPGVDGVETVARMWQIDPHLQVVICSAYSDHTFYDMMATLGHSDGLLVMRKPFEAIEVLQAAHTLCQKWEVSAKLRARLNDLELAVHRRTWELERSNRELRQEVEQRKQAEAQARHIATHDALTGIPNRHLLREALGRGLSRASRRNRGVAVLLLDLDNFKDVNDTYGHPAGDDLLKQVAQRLRECVRGSDMVARMGGDEFVLLLEDLSEPEEAAIVASRVLARCSEPFEVAGQRVHTPPSIGVAVFPDDCGDAETLLKIADVAMYEAKEAGGGTYRYYAEGMLSSSEEKLRMREQLMQAVANQQFILEYQPLVDLKSGAICSFEALLRWQHPEHGRIAPLKFIPVAEKSGIIVPLGSWVLRTACNKLAQWHRQGHHSLRIAVNVSAREVQAPGFVDLVKNTLKETGLAASALELELTESVATKEPEQSARVLQELRELGVLLAIDDFGTGYSSLLRLKQMPISVLKIDRYFIREITTNPNDAAIVRAVVEMAHSLGLTVVAEGVETQQQLMALRNIPPTPVSRTVCDCIQGYLISKPLSAEAADAMLEQSHAGRLALTGS